MNTRTKLSVVLLSVVALAASTAHGADKAPVNGLAKWVPAESILFIAYDGRNPASRKTALHDIRNEPEVKALLDGPLAALGKLIADEAAMKGMPDTNALAALLDTRIGITFIGLAPPEKERQEPTPEVLVIAEVGKPDSPQSKAVQLLVDYLNNEAGLTTEAFTDQEMAGVKAKVANVGPMRVAYATTPDGVFLLGIGNALAKALDPNAAKLADAEEFRRVSRHTGGNEVLLVYDNHASMMNKMGFAMPPDVARNLSDPELGLANVKSVSFACAPDGKGYKMSLFVHAPGERKGLLKLLAGKPLNPDIVKFAPKDSEFFYARSVNPGEVWDFIVALAVKEDVRNKEKIDRDLAEANKALGFDLRNDFVASLGDEFAVFGPGLTAVAKVKDRAKFDLCVKSMLARLAGEIAKDPEMRGATLTLDTMPYDEHTIVYVDSTRVPLFFQPCYTIMGDYAVFACYPASLKAYLLKVKGGKTLVDNADFKAVRAKMGAGASAIYYADTVGFMGGLYDILPAAAGFLKMVPLKYQPLCPDPATMPPFAVVSKHLFGSTAGCRPVEDGILWESYSPFGLPTPSAMRQGGMATTAILAGMLLPALGRAREAALQTKNKNNLAGLGKATALWLADEGENRFYPPSLKALWDDGIVEDPRMFINPATGHELVEGEFVCDYDSLFDRAGFTINEMMVQWHMPMIWDKEQVFPGGRCVVFFDTHVEFVPEYEFEELMEMVDEWVEEHRPTTQEEREEEPQVPKLETTPERQEQIDF